MVAPSRQPAAPAPAHRCAGRPDIAVAPREYANVGVAAIDHVDHLAERCRRRRDDVFHREHLVAKLPQHPNRRARCSFRSSNDEDTKMRMAAFPS